MVTPNKELVNHTRLRTGFINLAQQGWTAGGQYLKNVFHALHALPGNERPDILLVTQSGSLANEVDMLAPYLKQPLEIRYSAWERYMKSVYLRLSLPHWLEKSLVPRKELAAVLRQHEIDVLFSNDEYGPGFPVPLVAWIPDFQQKHLSELFSRSKIRTRERHNQRIAAFAQRVLLSSQAAFQDFAAFAPEAIDKARVVHFVAQPPPDVYDHDPAEICRQYQLPDRFIYLPNQFWRHKNHQAVVAALALLIDSHPEVVVACTGNTYEFRGPGYFSELMQQAQTLGITEKFRYLGILPHAHIYQLMRQSLAVLQPSRFEGWSTTVEEARSIGKSLILSDIPVHREQNPPGSVFFDPGSPEDLANCLVAAYQDRQFGPDQVMEENARQALPLRTQEFGRAFLEVLRQAASEKR